MLLKLIHIGFGCVIASLIAAAVLLACNGDEIAGIVIVIVVMAFTWVSIWRGITDARKEELLDKVDEIDEDDSEQEMPDDVPGKACRRSDQIQAGMPRRNEDIHRL